MPRKGIAGSYGSTLFSIVAASIYIPTKSVGRFPFLHTFSSICFLQTFLMVAILTSVRWHLVVVLICIFLIISQVEYLLMCLLATCISLGTIILPATGFLDHTPLKSYLAPNPYLRLCFWGPNPHPEIKHTQLSLQGPPSSAPGSPSETSVCGIDVTLCDSHSEPNTPTGGHFSQKLLSFGCRKMKFCFKVTLMVCSSKRNTQNDISCFPQTSQSPSVSSSCSPQAFGSQACVWDRTDALLS